MKYLFILFLVFWISAQAVAVIDIFKISKAGKDRSLSVWLWVLLALPIAGPIIYLSLKKNRNKQQ
jgi:hypothetical protein